jgi:hypothetical protein
MTTRRSSAKSAARQLDALVNRSGVKLYTHSPNDVLVQIALPLILILAITTRLTMLAYDLVSQRDTTPAVMELWQQQLIMRIDQALEAWEKEAHLEAFPDANSIEWAHAWPEDNDFKTLCNKANGLNEPAQLRDTILSSALSDQKAATPKTIGALIPESATLTDSREMAYAATYIGQRIASWSDQIESLQWDTVARIATGLPLANGQTEANAGSQLRAIASQLDTRGYPLLNSIKNEYGNQRTEP